MTTTFNKHDKVRLNARFGRPANEVYVVADSPAERKEKPDPQIITVFPIDGGIAVAAHHDALEHVSK